MADHSSIPDEEVREDIRVTRIEIDYWAQIQHGHHALATMPWAEPEEGRTHSLAARHAEGEVGRRQAFVNKLRGILVSRQCQREYLPGYFCTLPKDHAGEPCQE